MKFLLVLAQAYLCLLNAKISGYYQNSFMFCGRLSSELNPKLSLLFECLPS